MQGKIIKVGIFWAVPDGSGGQSALEFSKNCIPAQANKLGFVNYPYSHFEMWDKVNSGIWVDDCYYYPRGRVIFDINRNKHLVYADKCVSKQVIIQLVKLYGIEDYELLRDEHYVCPKCMKTENSLYCFEFLRYNILNERKNDGVYKKSDGGKN